MGVIDDEPSEAVEALLQYIDMAVAQGDLWGNGNESYGPNKIEALKDMVESTGDLIDSGDYDIACSQLDSIYALIDGALRPKDLVEGPATVTIALAILEILNDLGCSSEYWCSVNSECADGIIYFCAKLPGDCGWKGSCELIPLECPDIHDPVCGCNGITYSSSCAAAADGMNIAYEGTCMIVCEPTNEKENGNLCWDGIDNDCDGFIDRKDPGCKKPEWK
jgi:hypothetical protein